MNTSIIQRFANAFNGIIQFFSNNTIWLHIMFIWAISVIFTNESDSRNWLVFTPIFSLLCVAFAPTLIFSFFRKPLKEQLHKWLFYGVSLAVFVAYPLILIGTPAYVQLNQFGVFDFHHTNNDDVIFYVLFYIGLAFFFLEIAINIRTNWTYEFKFIKRIKKLSLEQALLIILGLFAGFFSLMTLGSNHVGINSFAEIPLFTVKWFLISIQFYWMLLTYYLFYWINHYVLINKVLKQKGLIPYVFSFMFVALIGYPISAQIIWWISSIKFFSVDAIIKQGAFDGVFFLVPFLEMLVSIPFILAIQWFRQTSEIAVLEKEKSEAELTLLKQQINPHFFFNTLNNLYALSLKKDEATPEVILQLSELMRYVIYKGKEETVKLGDEIKYIEDYCELQQIRLHKNLDFRFTQNIADETIRISPLLFIILVENAFKHGIEPAEKECYLHINLESDENGLTFICENSYEDENDKPKGIGLDNLRKRLELRYPNQHSLEIIDDGQIYKTILRLTVDG